MIVIAKYRHSYEAEVARAALEAEGIESAVLDNAGSVMPSFPSLLPVRLAVHAEDEERAREVLRETPQ